ncbi:hypothetical protein PENSPDRAFT_662737 [Peniophora sp. CONT]|nr:hypothetical protein PENSPDRAFT_662737 [Peniophora sp. CONT]
MDLHSIYSEELEKAHSRLGRAIPNPQPGFLSSRASLPRVKIGDVGYIEKSDGRFIRLFNVHSSPHGNGRHDQGIYPEEFTPEDRNASSAARQGAYSENKPLSYRSSSIKSSRVDAGVSGPSPIGESGIHLQFSSTSKRGAVLVVPDPVRSYNSTRKEVDIYKKYWASNLPGWRRFLSRECVRPDELLLVTGMDQTTSWSTAVHDDSELSAGFGVRVTYPCVAGAHVGAQFDWSHHQAVERNTNPHIPDERGKPARVHTVFIRYVRATSSFLGIKMEAGAEPREPDVDKGGPEAGTDALVVQVPSSSEEPQFTDSLTPVHEYILQVWGHQLYDKYRMINTGIQNSNAKGKLVNCCICFWKRYR